MLPTPSPPDRAMLHPAFLIAATVTDDGWIELPAAGTGTAHPVDRLHVAPGADGGFVQRVVPPAGRDEPWQPFEMAFFARCLALALGPVTPGLFEVRGVGALGSSRGRLARTDAASEAARLQVLRSAFLAHLAAYEEGFV